VESIHLKHGEYVFKSQKEHVHGMFIDKARAHMNPDDKGRYVGDAI
jgi:hypothetical protein